MQLNIPKKTGGDGIVTSAVLSSLSVALSTCRPLCPTKNIYAAAAVAVAGIIPNVLQYQCATENNARSNNTRNEREFASYCFVLPP
jgi:hypothetical protein